MCKIWNENVRALIKYQRDDFKEIKQNRATKQHICKAVIGEWVFESFLTWLLYWDGHLLTFCRKTTNKMFSEVILLPKKNSNNTQTVGSFRAPGRTSAAVISDEVKTTQGVQGDPSYHLCPPPPQAIQRPETLTSQKEKFWTSPPPEHCQPAWVGLQSEQLNQAAAPQHNNPCEAEWLEAPASN